MSTGCISYGICMAYSSSAIPSMLAPNNSLTIDLGIYETTWMSESMTSLWAAHSSKHTLPAARVAALLFGEADTAQTWLGGFPTIGALITL